MKRLFVAVAILLASVGGVRADEKILFDIGSFKVYVPFHEINGVGLWDFVGKRGLAGAETPVARFKNFQFVGGGITSLDGEGSPYVGVHIVLSSPAENWIPISGFQPGIFGGRDFRNNAWLLGLKASVGLF